MSAARVSARFPILRAGYSLYNIVIRSLYYVLVVDKINDNNGQQYQQREEINRLVGCVIFHKKLGLFVNRLAFRVGGYENLINTSK